MSKILERLVIKRFGRKGAGLRSTFEIHNNFEIKMFATIRMS